MPQLKQKLNFEEVEHLDQLLELLINKKHVFMKESYLGLDLFFFFQ
jgi:hypothetical protein